MDDSDEAIWVILRHRRRRGRNEQPCNRGGEKSCLAHAGVSELTRDHIRSRTRSCSLEIFFARPQREAGACPVVLGTGGLFAWVLLLGVLARSSPVVLL